MGWWKIEPETGEAIGNFSALSIPPDFNLLNAVPGVDNDEAAYYLGDGPLDMASMLPEEVAVVIDTGIRLTDEDVRQLFLRSVVPPGCRKVDVASQLLKVVDLFWKDIDGCYEDDWERHAQPAEKRWICEEVVRYLNHRNG